MNHLVKDALWQFSQRFVSCWQTRHASLPVTDAYAGIASPCEDNTVDGLIFWTPKQRDEMASFDQVESAIELSIHEDVKTFYACQYAGDLRAKFEGKPLELIQVWSDDDLIRLQENILGHLVMQRRLKLSPTIFIGTTPNEMDLISVCNVSGEVIFETLGTQNRQVLAPDVVTFLTQLEPDLDDACLSQN